MGLLLKTLKRVANAGFNGFRSQSRQYHSYSAFLIPGRRLPTTRAAAVDSIVEQIDLATQAGFFKSKPGILNIVSGFEFGFNGVQNPETGEYEYSARNRVPKSWYIDMVAAAQDRLSKLPDGNLYCPGTVALDTETTLDNKPVGENRGFLMSSGKELDLVEFTKANPHAIDGWEQGITVVGEGPILYRARDVLGGRDVWVAVAVCFDYTKELASGRVRFPIKPDIILSPSAGWPKSNSPDDVSVIVNDAIHNPFSDTALFRNTAEWKPIEEEPVLKKVLTSLNNAYPVATPYLTALEMLLLKSDWLSDYVKPYKDMSPLPYSVVSFGNEEAVSTGERTLAQDMTAEQLTQVANAVVHDKATLVTDGMGQTEVRQYIEKIGNIITTNNLPWDYIATEVERFIQSQVQEALNSKTSDLLTKDVDKLSQDLITPDFENSIQQKLGSLIQEALGGTDYEKVLNALGSQKTDYLVTVVASQQRFQKMVESNYLKNIVESRILQEKIHSLDQTAGDIQKQIDEQTKAISLTTQEKTDLDIRAKELQDEIDKASEREKQDLEIRKQMLEQDIEKVEAKLKKQNQEKENSEKEKQRRESPDWESEKARDEQDYEKEQQQKQREASQQKDKIFK